MNTFKEPISKKKKKLKASRERAKFKIMPTDGASVCWQIGQDRRQLDLVKEEKKIVDNE